MEILLDNRQKRITVEPNDLIRKAEKLLEGSGCSPSAVLSISIVDSDEMSELNRRFRGKEGPTNVLSFPQSEKEDGPQPQLLGDVVICADRALSDARDLGYTEDEMVLYLLIHGVLHLVGYVHDEPQDAAEMERRVEQLFQKLSPDQR